MRALFATPQRIVVATQKYNSGPLVVRFIYRTCCVPGPGPVSGCRQLALICLDGAINYGCVELKIDKERNTTKPQAPAASLSAPSTYPLLGETHPGAERYTALRQLPKFTASKCHSSASVYYYTSKGGMVVATARSVRRLRAPEFLAASHKSTAGLGRCGVALCCTRDAEASPKLRFRFDIKQMAPPRPQQAYWHTYLVSVPWHPHRRGSCI